MTLISEAMISTIYKDDNHHEQISVYGERDQKGRKSQADPDCLVSEWRDLMKRLTRLRTMPHGAV